MRHVLTDSGATHEETTVFRVPCVTLGESTERPASVPYSVATTCVGSPIGP
ncbi:MAG: hypothetical protein EXR76_06755 [Myxococcales bacterium]|nr:hypothetical protein [Myxococcales bacterium]